MTKFFIFNRAKDRDRAADGAIKVAAGLVVVSSFFLTFNRPDNKVAALLAGLMAVAAFGVSMAIENCPTREEETRKASAMQLNR